jgi:uncharacterized protein YjdB
MVSLTVGQTETLTASFVDSGNNPVTVPDPMQIVWSVPWYSPVKLSAYGETVSGPVVHVTGAFVGTVNVTATYNNGIVLLSTVTQVVVSASSTAAAIVVTES